MKRQSCGDQGRHGDWLVQVHMVSFTTNLQICLPYLVRRHISALLKRIDRRRGVQMGNMDPKTDRNEARLVELEIRFTHQQALLDELSDLIRSQASDIVRLKDEIVRLRDSIRPEEDEQRPPPHY
ncbi:MAG: SlyX family protein [Myxococcota bacterium]|nr:SlyX family protein [Myxococcota bacterium]